MPPIEENDLFVLYRDDDSLRKVTFEQLKEEINPTPAGTINTPTVLAPADGAGDGSQRYLKSDAITEVEGGGIKTCETDEIQSVDDSRVAPTYSSSGTGTYGQTVGSGALNGNLEPPEVGVTPADRTFIGGLASGGSGTITISPTVTANTSIVVRCYIDGIGVGNSRPVEFGSETINVEGGGDNSWNWKNYTLSAKSLSTISYSVGPDNAGRAQNFQFAGFYIDGVWHKNGRSLPPLLTFPSSNGFDCFADGDVVQGNELPTTVHGKGNDIFTSWDDPTNHDCGVFDFGGLNPNPEAATNWGYLYFDAGITTKVGWQFYADSPPLTYNMWGSLDGTNWTQYVFDERMAGINDPVGFINPVNYRYYVLQYASPNLGADSYAPTVTDEPEVKVISKDEDANTITVDGGDWLGSDGSGTAGGDTKLFKETAYDTKLTVAGSTDLADMSGATFMSDGTGAPGPYSQTPYKLVTSEITSVTNPPNTYQIKGVGINSSGKSPSKADCLATTWNSAGAVLETNNFGTAETFGEYRQAQIYDLGAPLTHVYFSVNHTERVNWHAEIYGSNDPDTAFIELLDQKSFLDRDNPDGWLDSGSTPYRYIMFMGNFVGDDVTDDPRGLIIKNYGIKSTFTPGITLAFADPNPDLQYFKAGDVVQGIDVTETYDFKGSDDFVAYDSAGAVLETVNFGGTVTNTTVVNNLYYDVKVPRANLVFVRYAGFTDGNTFVLFGSNDPSSAGWTELVRQDSISDDDTFTNGSSPYRYFVLNCTGQMNPSKYGIATEIAGDAVKVISTGYPNSNTMTVDGGTWNAGDVVEYQTNGGQGEIVSVNTDDNTILLTETGDRDNRWIAENKAATDFYVAGPQIVDEPLLTADVELQSSNFATTPDNADSLKNIVWELNGAEQNAGTSNPYKPSGLALNTEYTVRVKHQGNALEDSAWSTSTTFTTGATRNLYTYYKERLQVLETRLAGIETEHENMNSNYGSNSY